jgi:general secretion pathway protein K
MHIYISVKRQQGVVLLVALFIVALIATMSYLMMSRLERDTRRISLLLRNTQAEYYAQGSIAWAIDALRTNWLKQQGKQNKLIDLIPMKSPINEMNGYKIESTIYDMQSKYNLNNLTKPDNQADFKRLLQNVDANITEQKAQEIVLAVTDWISPTQAEIDNSKYYMSLSPAYRAPHELMVSVSELQLVKGMTPSLYQALEPYVTALPKTTLINVQTALSPVLVTLSSTLTPSIAKTIEQIRKQNPIISPQMFASLDIVKNHNISTDKITTVSNYFLLETKVTIENQHIVLYTLFERITSGDKVVCNILWQSKGVPI